MSALAIAVTTTSSSASREERRYVSEVRESEILTSAVAGQPSAMLDCRLQSLLRRKVTYGKPCLLQVVTLELGQETKQ
jgi:hypothetical protein